MNLCILAFSGVYNDRFVVHYIYNIYGNIYLALCVSQFFSLTKGAAYSLYAKVSKERDFVHHVGRASCHILIQKRLLILEYAVR
jgi:hypothetical protein